MEGESPTVSVGLGHVKRKKLIEYEHKTCSERLSGRDELLHANQLWLGNLSMPKWGQDNKKAHGFPPHFWIGVYVEIIGILDASTTSLYTIGGNVEEIFVQEDK